MDLHLDPLDFQNFLLINPPLTEYADYAIVDESAGPQPQRNPQRRLSISNGQISQITQMAHSSQGLGSGHGHHHPQHVPFNDDMMFNSSQAQQQAPVAPLPVQIQPQQIPLQIPPLTPDEQPRLQQRPSAMAVDFNGVPTQPLIYDNEVIFDPNPQNGPIPGTTAWKKQRILERNRLAASKCRQKKKHQQKKLAEELDDLRFERAVNTAVKPIVQAKISKWVRSKDPQLAALSDTQILKLVLFDGSDKDQIVNSWLM